MWRRPFLSIVLSALAALPALAVERSFPVSTLRGTLSPAPYPEIVMNGKLRHLAPGARIWSQDNLIQTPASLVGQDLPVNYTENEQGDIDRIWLLSDDESNTPLAKQINSQSR